MDTVTQEDNNALDQRLPRERHSFSFSQLRLYVYTIYMLIMLRTKSQEGIKKKGGSIQ